MTEEVHVGLLLFIAYRDLEGRVITGLQQAGFDITAAQARVLQRVGPDGTRLTDLAAQAQVTKQTAGFLVDQLERAGYVERTADPTDARARLVRLARRGREAAVVAERGVTEVEAQWRRYLGEDQFDRLAQALSRLREITDPYR